MPTPRPSLPASPAVARGLRPRPEQATMLERPCKGLIAAGAPDDADINVATHAGISARRPSPAASMSMPRQPQKFDRDGSPPQILCRFTLRGSLPTSTRLLLRGTTPPARAPDAAAGRALVWRSQDGLFGKVRF